uniref:NET domain-containing protein n=1 Tax=viral metagenome TaxID=1070528 RepID=A0A6C0EXX5_9ZZZZ
MPPISKKKNILSQITVNQIVSPLDNNTASLGSSYTSGIPELAEEPKDLLVKDNFFSSIIELPPLYQSNSQTNSQSNIHSHSNINSNTQSGTSSRSSSPPSSPKTLQNKKLNKGLIILSNTEIKNKIEQLSEHELTEIFKIIKNNNEKYSTNKNGIFINLSTLKKCSIQEISNFISFCETNNKIIDQDEQTRDIYRDIILEN